MNPLDPTRVLFVGISSSAICYYRCALPATAIGADWVGVHGDPPDLVIDTGIVKGHTQKPVMLGGDYDVLVLQEVAGQGWLKLITDAQERGIRVVYEVNDYLHGIPTLVDHGFKKFYTPERLAGIQACMEAADAVTTTTRYLKTKYKKFARKEIYVVPNGIDLNRYDLTKPKRELDVNVGWAGATGHYEALAPWLIQVAGLMDLRPNINFVSIGMKVADEFVPRYGSRALSVPWAAMEQYPAAMTLFDIAIAPAANTKFHRGKSDLRWVEASALGIPVVANPILYPEMQHGATGFAASNQDQVLEYLIALAEDKPMREVIGEAARTHVREHRSIEAIVPKWQRALAGQ